MRFVLPAQSKIKLDEEKAPQPEKRSFWWKNWEIYLILLLAAGLRLYRIDTAQFMADHSTFYQMAYDGLKYGLWPITANQSSTGPLFPPLFIYIMMIPAAISSDPIAGNIFVAFCNIIAVLLTYGLVGRYYGRLAGTFAALLYATAVNVIVFSRDIWQPDLLPLCAICLMWLLFRGVAEGKRYWFLPSVLIVGTMYLIHNSAVYLVIPLCVAMVLAFRSIRWRELPLAAIGLLILFAPFLYLEWKDGLAEIHVLSKVARQPAKIDDNALKLYRVFLHSFVLNPFHQYHDTHLIPSNENSILRGPFLIHVAGLASRVSRLMDFLLAGGVLASIVQLLWPEHSAQKGLAGWWKGLFASPQRKGLLLLLVWQSLVLLMLRHPVELYIHYLTFLLPGPFILIGILLANSVKLVSAISWIKPSWERLVRYGLCLSVGLVVLAQTGASAGWLIDHARGNFNSTYAFPDYFDLASVQRLINDSEQVAQQQHLSRIYLENTWDAHTAMRYLEQFGKVPINTVDTLQCAVLPGAEAGLVVFVVEPGHPEIESLLNYYTSVQSLKEIRHPGGTPYKLYILKAKPETRTALQLSGNMRLLAGQAQIISGQGKGQRWLISRWQSLNAQSPRPRATYQYSYQIQGANIKGNQRVCGQTRGWAGDQIIPISKLTGIAPQQISTRIALSATEPQHYDLGGMKLVTYLSSETFHHDVQGPDGKQQINIPVNATDSAI